MFETGNLVVHEELGVHVCECYFCCLGQVPTAVPVQLYPTELLVNCSEMIRNNMLEIMIEM